MIEKTTERNQSIVYISPEHKAKLRAYAESQGRSMRKTVELWINSLPNT